MSTTRSVLRQEAAKLIGALLKYGDATGGNAGTLVDAGGDSGIRDTGLAASLFQGAYLLMTGGSNAGVWRTITPNGYSPSTGSLTVGEPFSNAVSAGDSYEIYLLFDPDQWNDIIDDALAKLRHRIRTPLSMISDADMELTNVDNWAAGAGAGRAKITSGQFISGTQALQVTNSLAGGYVQSVSVSCTPRDSFTAWVDYQSLAGTARLRAWDVTNGVSLFESTGSDNGMNGEGGMIQIGFTAGSTTRAVALRLLGDEASAVINWDNLILMRGGRKRYTLPSWITEADQIIEFRERHGVRPNDYTYTNVGYPLDVEEDWTAVSPYVVVLPNGTPRPVFIDAMRPFAALSSDSSTTSCPFELARYAVATEALLRLTPAQEAQSSRLEVGRSKEEIFRAFTELRRRLQPLRPRPQGPKQEWVATP
jgi:hypothetical protein